MKRRFGGNSGELRPSSVELAGIFERYRMRVLFYQPDYTGHHLAYLARMLPGFVDLPIEIVLATTAEAIASQEFSQSLAAFGDRLKLVPCCTRPPARLAAQLSTPLERVGGGDSNDPPRSRGSVLCRRNMGDGIRVDAHGPPAVGARAGGRGMAVSRAICRTGRSTF